MLYLVFLISTRVKCDHLRIVMTLHHANLLSKRSKPRRHPSPVYFILLFAHFVLVHVIKRISNEFPFHTMYYETRCVFYIPSPEARGYKTYNSFHNTSYGMKIHLRSYIYHYIFTALILFTVDLFIEFEGFREHWGWCGRKHFKNVNRDAVPVVASHFEFTMVPYS